ncbi:MAG: asparaginase domain-containing protein [Phycisphaerales bacterium]|jgi:L-asparaginase
MNTSLPLRHRLAIVSTGGTIEKTYDEFGGVLANAIGERLSVLDVMLASLELRDLEIERIPLMNKDSLEMTPEDHEAIAATAEEALRSHEAVLVVHGTDRLAVSGEAILARLSAHGELRGPVVLTGAMRPYELRRTDAIQNLTEALLAARILPPGVYCVMHNEVLPFPGVQKDRAAMRFRRIVRTEEHSA